MRHPLKSPFLILALALALAPACKPKPKPEPAVKPAVKAEKPLNKSVVKVFTTVQKVDFYEPWKPGTQAQQEGCGVILPGGHILTTSHITNKSNYIEVQKFGQTKRYVAKVEQVGYDLDLSLLSIEDQEFYKDTEPVEFGDLPSPGDKVTVQGGDELSVKQDTISGLDMFWSTEAGRFLPALITYTDVDNKNNGCPVFLNGKFIGLPFEVVHSPEKTASLLPVNVVQRFLEGVKDGKTYDGFPDLGVEVQTLENPTLQSYEGLPADKTGVVVTKVLYQGSAEGLLKEGDILTAIDGHPIDNEGDINLVKNQRIDYSYLITFYQMGQSVSLDIFREGKAQSLMVPLKPLPRLVSYRSDDTHPTYYLYAGFVFVPLTTSYFQSKAAYKPSFKKLMQQGLPSPQRQEVVLISHVLPHDINVGYDKQFNLIVDKVNGMPITRMKDLITALGKPAGRYQVIEIDEHAWFGSKIVFEAAKAKKATAEIMAELQIPEDRSKDLGKGN